MVITFNNRQAKAAWTIKQLIDILLQTMAPVKKPYHLNNFNNKYLAIKIHAEMDKKLIFHVANV